MQASAPTGFAARLAPKQLRRLLHPLGNFYAKGAAALAGMAVDAGRGGLFQQFVVALHSSGHFGLHGGQVVELVDHRNVQVGHAGLAVAAVGTFAPVGMEGPANWEKVSDAEKYVVYLYKDGQILKIVEAADNDYDFAKNITDPGLYAFSIVAVSGIPEYKNSRRTIPGDILQYVKISGVESVKKCTYNRKSQLGYEVPHLESYRDSCCR